MLPKNEPKAFDRTPKKFFIWGSSMSGKTYLAIKFPNPLLLNTDGNCEKIATPSLYIRSYSDLINVLKELEQGKHTFETIIIDLIDDIEYLLINYILETENSNSKKDIKYETLNDIPFGKGFYRFKKLWKSFIIKLTSLPYNVIFISHIKELKQDDITVIVPSLSGECLNVALGRCDVQIETKKIGQLYQKKATMKRDIYKEEDFKNKKIFEILKDTIGLINK